MMTLPEHMLSFKLSGIQCLSSQKIAESVPMIAVQKWLENKSRDIIDECDYILSVRTQLIYPSGAQSTLEAPRWKTAQAILAICRGHLPELRKQFLRGIEIVERAGYPIVYMQHDAVKSALLERVTTSVLNGAGGILPVKDCTTTELELIEVFLRAPKLAKDVATRAADLFKDRQGLWKDMLLCRGLLVHRILVHALLKRWNVQYGLHPDRDPVAVPYHAKSVPSEQAGTSCVLLQVRKSLIVS